MAHDVMQLPCLRFDNVRPHLVGFQAFLLDPHTLQVSVYILEACCKGSLGFNVKLSLFHIYDTLYIY